MPDFGKALKTIRGGRNGSGDFARQFAGVGSLSLAEQLHLLRSSRSSSVHTLPPGELRSNASGSHYFIENVYPEDYFHGKVRLSRFCSPDLQSLLALMRETGTVPSRDRIVFLDTETTGLQGGTGMCPFLIGIGYFSGDDFRMVQYFIRDFDDEPSMLLALAEQLRQFDLTVTYNGAAFDIPLLETRFTLARLDSPFEPMSHFDLLFTARKLWRHGHGSCRLTALERELISFLRGPDIPGAMIPRVFFEFVQRRPTAALQSVFTHNVHDVVSLAALTVHACDRVILEPAALDEPLDLYSLACVLDGSLDWRRCIRMYEMALAGGIAEPMRKKALERLAVACRRVGEHERSLEVCIELMQGGEFSMIAVEGAAIYYERVARDFEAALAVLEDGLARAESIKSKRLLQSRWDRLQQKRLL